MRTNPVVLAVAVLFALSGCVPSDSHPSSAPSVSATPVFASDAEALAAAEKAYAAYLKVSDQILVDGGSNPERLKEVVTDAVYRDERIGFESIRDKGWHSTGGSKADNFSVEQFSPYDPEGVVTVYLCSDVSGVDVLDSSNESVVSPGRPVRTPFEVTFAYKQTAKSLLVVSNKEVWTGGGIC